ncbi:hypothetical protein EJ05DRAFT_476914 [Pseudovirgaria hyperparasitica]|uniref:Uncharacterized protein n=1 Tax=Pseudovirgaria hyperparasitica TaxID=470096 RepID=A0A6A6W6V9_9PEZI|nr:uncharacterized protein EJ05DRAFT_476914 [Pseudovirgaria hyperparasitica]KAF2757700.1 hypothetical protein EJ05DRAFT_476914 [Pseudovirgaria hyperparasitica]
MDSTHDNLFRSAPPSDAAYIFRDEGYKTLEDTPATSDSILHRAILSNEPDQISEESFRWFTVAPAHRKYTPPGQIETPTFSFLCSTKLERAVVIVSVAYNYFPEKRSNTEKIYMSRILSDAVLAANAQVKTIGQIVFVQIGSLNVRKELDMLFFRYGENYVDTTEPASIDIVMNTQLCKGLVRAMHEDDPPSLWIEKEIVRIRASRKLTHYLIIDLD